MLQETVVDDPNKHSDEFDFDLRFRLRGKRRKVVLPWLVAGLALIGSTSFWKVFERFLIGGG